MHQSYRIQDDPYDEQHEIPTRYTRFLDATGPRCKYWCNIGCQACLVPAIGTFSIISVGLLTLRAFGFTFALDVIVSV